MKCICGYEKLGRGYVLVPAREELYQYGRNKGKVKRVIPESHQWRDQDPENPSFTEIEVIGRLGDVTLYSCPKCGTVKLPV